MSNRIARCECGRTNPSDQPLPGYKELPFFTDCGPGSQWSEVHCAVCGAHASGHDSRVSDRDHPFKPGYVAEFDDFYCGCRGWD